MFKRIALFALTNLLVVLTVSLILGVLGVGKYTSRYGIDYTQLMIYCLIWGMVGAFISLAISRISAKMFMGVKVIDPQAPGQFAALVEAVHGFAKKAKLPAMPEVGIYESPEVNAFATGPSRSRSLVAVSTGLLRQMNKDEMDGVLGHEVAHIANGDMVTMTLIQGVINAFVMFLARVIAFALSARRSDDGESSGHGNFLVVMLLEMLLSPLGFIVVAWFSRMREFRADAGGAAYAGKGRMVGALQALNRVYGRFEGEDKPAIQTLKISGKQSGFMHLFSTHPPLEERIARLNSQR